MRPLGGMFAAAMLVVAIGCGRGVEAAAKKPDAPKTDPYKSWPADNIAKPGDAGAVDETVLREPNDAEPMRVPSQFSLPDWAQQEEPLVYKSPKGSRIEIHYMQRGEDLRKADDAKIAALVSGKKDPQAYLVVARPWRGWYSEANSLSGDKRVRVYLLFQPERQLELHVEWLKASPKAYEEAMAMVAQVVHSISDVDKSAEG